ncbi:MAG TPA: UTP--glucose-1-phosphate uridylyltransferase [Bryobacteraceae bacterium]|nr:UTP--glucose-1-phosphate uridylyltransferase [Bryobacteraceae bacterium]
MSRLIEIITSDDPLIRDRSLDAVCQELTIQQLRAECDDLDRFRRTSSNLYERVRALFFLYAIHRFHIPLRDRGAAPAAIPFAGYTHLLKRRYEEAIDIFLAAQASLGAGAAISSALAAAYRGLGFQTLAGQVRHSVRSVRGNQWMFRTGHPEDYPLRLRRELLQVEGGMFPVLRESTPVRMDLTHSGWSDIFFLGMDFPEGARVVNISVDLAVRAGAGENGPKPPVEAYLRVIDQPVLRLVSVDLGATAEISTIDEVFDFARDYLSLLKAAVIASGLVPPGMEGAVQPLAQILERLTGARGLGIEIVSKVNGIPKGSRLAVSTTLLGSLISACMRATGQIHSLEGGLQEDERRLVAARAILGEWLGGSGGGWQDSGGVWPGIKLIHGVAAAEGDPEFGVSRGCLLPRHRIFDRDEISSETRDLLQSSLVLVHGGMAQDVGPILEMVTERYLLRSEKEWTARREAMALLDEVIEELRAGDVRAIGGSTDRNFSGPIQTIIPWAANLYTATLIESVRAEMGEDFWGFWMLGGMSGGGMGFLFDPRRKPEALVRLQHIMTATKKRMEHAVPFAMEPVVYDFAINESGTVAALLRGPDALLPAEYYTLAVPPLVRTEARLLSPSRRAELDRFAAACRERSEFSGMVQQMFDHLLPRSGDQQTGAGQTLAALLEAYGFDATQHRQIQADLRSGRIGLAQNRLPASTDITDVHQGDAIDAVHGLPGRYREIGLEALRSGSVAVLTLAGGTGSRWTKGAGVVKALNPFCRLGGRHRSFLEVHLAKSRRTSELAGAAVPHVFTTSYLTHDAIAEHLRDRENYGYPGAVLLSPGRSIGLRMIPMERDLRFAWEEMPQQLLDEQAQKVRESLHQTLIQWARQAGEGSDYTDNLPLQCLHPVGHWYEVANLLRNGTLARLMESSRHLRYLLVHNIDTAGAAIDPELLGYHIDEGAGLTAEVIARHLEDRGGGLARVNGRLRLVEGMALPHEEVESQLSYYNSATYWVDVDKLLAVAGLTREDLGRADKVMEQTRRLAARMPSYITLKDVKKRWGKGQEDVFPVAQFEKLWGDMTSLSGLECRYLVVPRVRGQQLKEPSQLDAWLRDGSAAEIERLCGWR